MNQPLSVKMRRYEVIGGVVWLIFYGFFMGDVLALLLGLLGIPYTGAQLNAVYFLSNFVITALLFRRFLAYSLPVAADHLLRCLKAMLLGFCLYWILQVGLDLLGQLLNGKVSIPNDDTVASIAGENYRIMGRCGTAGTADGGNAGAGPDLWQSAPVEPSGGLWRSGGGVCGDACASLSWPDGCAEHLL